MSVFKCNNLLAKACRVQFLLSAWGIPWTERKGSGYYTPFKAQSEDRNLNPTFFLKDCDERELQRTGIPVGNQEEHTKIKTCSDFLNCPRS